MSYTLIKLCILFHITANCVRSEETAYVSRFSGNDTKKCGKQSVPCRTISYALQQVSQGATIYLDGTNTSKDPYSCQTLEPGHLGVYLTKSISFVGIKTRANISCLHGNRWLVNGTKRKGGIRVNFNGLAFSNTSLRFFDALVNIKDSLFLDSQSVSMNFVIISLDRFDLTLNNVVFKRNTFCMFITSSTNVKIFIVMKNSSFLQNGNRDSSTLPLPSILLLSSRKSNIDIKLTNCRFKRNIFKQTGMIIVRNSQATTKLLLDRIKFEDNGHISTLTGLPNAILVLRSAHVITTLDFGFVHNTFGTFLAVIGQSAQINVSNAVVENFYSPDKGGGVFYISASMSASFSIKDSCFRHGKSISYAGVILILAPNLMLTIENSVFHNISNLGSVGSVYVKSYDVKSRNPNENVLRVNIINSSFSDCVSLDKGTVYVYARHLFLNISESWFERNSVKGAGAALMFVTYGDAVIRFKNVYFFQNSASDRGIVAGRSAGNGSTFSFTCNNVSFVDNELRTQQIADNGILYLVIKRKISSINFTRTRFIRNTGVNSSVIFLLLWNSSSTANSIALDACIFRENFADISFSVNGQATLTCEHSIFHSNSNSGFERPVFVAIMSNSNIRISNSTFVNNCCGTVFISLDKSSCLEIADSKFLSNRYLKGVGGAVYIQMSNDHNGGNQKRNRCETLYHNVLIKNVWFQENMATIGGVLTISDAKVKIVNCVFVNNFARVTTGGQITTYGSTDIKVLHSEFKQTMQRIIVNETEFVVSSFLRIYSIGGLLLSNTTVVLDTISDEPLIIATGSVRIIIDKSSVTSCPLGYPLERSVYGYLEQRLFLTALDFSCKACDYNFYSLQRGYAKGMDVDNSFKCVPCPRGADCIPSITSKSNFWGYNSSLNPPTLEFTLCPFGYCKQPQANSSKYNDCQGQRTGVMCGSCSDGYTETLLSTHCTPIKDCNDCWFWILFLLLVSFLALLLVFKPPFLTYSLKHVLWFKRFTIIASNSQEFRYNNVNSSLSVDGEDGQENIPLSSREQLNHDKRQFSRFLEIIFYFYQIAQLLLSSYSVGEFFQSKILATVLGFFNFEPRLHKRGFICPFPGLTPKTKLAFKVLPVLGTMIAIFTFYFFHVVINKLCKSQHPSISSYLQAGIKTIFLGYTTLATVGISLIRCVPVAGEDRWFYNGNVICYQWWQYVSFAFNGIFVIPLIFVVAWASFKVHHGIVTVKQFMLAIVFPLPFLLLWFFRIVFPSEAVNVEESENFSAIKEMLLGPYKEPGNGSKHGAMYWQSVLIARRFILVLVFCTVTEPSIRLFCMTLACVVVLFFHLKVKPFRNALANNFESLSLFLLVVLGLINLLKSVFVGFEGIIKGPLVTVFKVFQWLEIVILGLFPALVSLLVCIAIISLLLRVLFTCCRSLFKYIFRRCAPTNLPQDTGRMVNFCQDINVH